MNLILKIYNEVLSGEIDKTVKLTKEAIMEKLDIKDIIESGFNNALKEVGIKFEKQEYFLPDLLVSAMAVKKGMEIIKPLLKKDSVKTLGTIAIGTVEGDLHDVGKNIVIMMLESIGFKVFDLGIDVNVNSFVDAVIKYKPDVLGMSALLNITMQNMSKVIDALKNKGLRDKVKIIVGGSPLNQEFSNLIGADGYAPDALKAVNKVKELLKL